MMRRFALLFVGVVAVLLGGYWLIEAPSKAEVVQWTQRCPAEEGDVIEIRQVFDAADFAIKK